VFIGTHKMRGHTILTTFGCLSPRSVESIPGELDHPQGNTHEAQCGYWAIDREVACHSRRISRLLTRICGWIPVAGTCKCGEHDGCSRRGWGRFVSLEFSSAAAGPVGAVGRWGWAGGGQLSTASTGHKAGSRSGPPASLAPSGAHRFCGRPDFSLGKQRAQGQRAAEQGRWNGRAPRAAHRQSRSAAQESGPYGIRPRASSVASSSSASSVPVSIRTWTSRAYCGIARIWNASATESSGRPPFQLWSSRVVFAVEPVGPLGKSLFG
jgi:hypothetical protein